LLGPVSCTDSEDDAGRPNEAPAIEPTGTDVSVADGRIVFMRGDPSREAGVAYTVDPDGTGERRLVPEGNSECATMPSSQQKTWGCRCDQVGNFVDPGYEGELLCALPPPRPRRASAVLA